MLLSSIFRVRAVTIVMQVIFLGGCLWGEYPSLLIWRRVSCCSCCFLLTLVSIWQGKDVSRRRVFVSDIEKAGLSPTFQFLSNICDLRYIYFAWSTCKVLDWSVFQRVEVTQELLQQFTNDSLSHASPHSKVSPELGSESPAKLISNHQLWTLLLIQIFLWKGPQRQDSNQLL